MVCGAIAVPVNAWWQGPELAAAVAESEPKVIVADSERIGRFQESGCAVPLIGADGAEDARHYEDCAFGEQLAADDIAVREPDDGQRMRDLGALDVAQRAVAQAKHGWMLCLRRDPRVLLNREGREYVGALERAPDATPRDPMRGPARDILAIDQDFAGRRPEIPPTSLHHGKRGKARGFGAQDARPERQRLPAGDADRLQLGVRPPTLRSDKQRHFPGRRRRSGH